MIKRVLLIDPPVTRPLDMTSEKVRIGLVAPLGLAYIAAVLEQQGIEVRILDCVAEGDLQGIPYSGENRYGLTDDVIACEIERFNPQLVGISCLFSNKAWDAHNICRIVKQVNPEIITVMGGAHPTALPEETLTDINVDFVCEGEGEGWFERFVRYNFICDHTLVELNILPLPARHLLRNDKYMSGESPHSGLKRIPVATIMTSRGCPGRCSFCAIRCLWGNKYRMCSPENVLAEIQHLIDTYKIKELHFEDDCFTANKKRTMAILQGIIDAKWDLTLNSPSGLAIFAMDEELLEKMREAGYYSISLAIESASQNTLKLMNKKVDLAKAKSLIAYARSLDMKTKAFFILGYPGETKKDMEMTINYASDLEADWCLFFPATPLPGTEMLKTCRKNGWLADPNMDYRYYFYKANIKTPEFNPEYIMKLKEKANYEINFKNNYNLKVGNYDKAIEDFNEVVKLYPDLKIAKDALQTARVANGLS